MFIIDQTLCIPLNDIKRVHQVLKWALLLTVSRNVSRNEEVFIGTSLLETNLTITCVSIDNKDSDFKRFCTRVSTERAFNCGNDFSLNQSAYLIVQDLTLFSSILVFLIRQDAEIAIWSPLQLAQTGRLLSLEHDLK